MTKPLLFMKTGVLEAEPLDFYGELADKYKALHINTDAIRLELNDGVFSQDRRLAWAVNAEAQRRSKVALEAGINVVYDGFLNTLRRRNAVREEVVTAAGAQAVLLVIHAPMRVIEERIKERHASDNLTIPSDQIPNVGQTIRLAYSMMNRTEWPDDSELPLRLDGQLSASTLFEQIAVHLEQAVATN